MYDEELQLVMKLVQNPDGWSEERRDVPSEARPYFDFREELNIIDGVLYKASIS